MYLTYHASHTPQINTVVKLVAKQNLRRSDRKWCVKCTRNMCVRERLAEVNDLDGLRQ